MPIFTVSLAGIPVGINVLCPSTEAFCREFLAEGPPAFTVTVRQEDITYEQSATQGTREPAYLETLALLRLVSERMADFDTVLFHGSVLAVRGKTYLFTAPSGTGKTTHTRLWLETVPGAHVLNGDKPFLRRAGNHILACGTPWRGKENYGTNEILPLEAICILSRDIVNHIEPVSAEKALPALIRQTYMPTGVQQKLNAIQVIGQVSKSVRLYHLGCNMDPESAQISAAAMIRD